MGELNKLPNIGAVLEQQLNAVGITNFEQLQNMGSKQAWLKIKEIDSSACINRLYSLEGAIRKIKKTVLPPEIKEDLKQFYNTMKE